MTLASFENSVPWVPLFESTTASGPSVSYRSVLALGQTDAGGLGNILPRQKGEGGRWSFDIFLYGDPSAVMGRTLMEKAFFNAFVSEGRGTAAPQPICFYWFSLERRRSRAAKQRTETTAQRLLEDIRNRSRLTLEEIGPLVGVSRRSLQNWRAGEVISARKEQRLRDIADTFESLQQKDARDLRHLLFERSDHGIRPYDLLAEGQFGTAYFAVTGQAAPDHLVTRSSTASLPPTPSLLARVSINDGGPPGTSGRLDLRRSRRLKR